MNKREGEGGCRRESAQEHMQLNGSIIVESLRFEDLQFGSSCCFFLSFFRKNDSPGYHSCPFPFFLSRDFVRFAVCFRGPLRGTSCT